MLSRSACVQLRIPKDCSPPGSSVYGIFQSRILAWLAISYSKGSSQPRDPTCVFCVFCVSCIGRQILYNWATWEDPQWTWLHVNLKTSSVQFSSAAQSCPTLCNPMNCSTSGFPVHHQHLEFTRTHVHRIGDAIQRSHPLSSPSPPAPTPFQHQGLFQWVNSLHEVAEVLEFQRQHQSFQWTPRTDLL